jgi:hypothetical protein
VPVTFVGNHVLRDAIEPGVVHDAGVVAVDHLAEEKRVGTDSSDPGRELAKEWARDRVGDIESPSVATTVQPVARHMCRPGEDLGVLVVECWQVVVALPRPP